MRVKTVEICYDNYKEWDIYRPLPYKIMKGVFAYVQT